MKLSENQRKVLATVRKKGIIAINDIVEISTLSPATSSRLINKLIKEKFLEQVYQDSSNNSNLSKGRPQKYVKWYGKGYYTICLDIGSTSIKGGIMDLNGTFYKEIEIENDPHIKLEVCFSKINDIIIKLYNTDLVDKSKILGIGIAFAGLINDNENIIKFSPAFGWHNVNPYDLLTKETGLPIYFDNVTRLMALCELYLGYGRSFSNFVFINIGYGIGSSIVINNEVYKGTNGYSGEFGHVFTKPHSSFKCSCGQNGCLTTTSSGEYITRRAIKRLEKGEHSSLEKIPLSDINTKIIFQEAEKGDKMCISVLDIAISHLAYRIADYERIIDTEAFIIGGGVSFSENYFFGELKKKMDKLNMEYPKSNKTQIFPRTFKDRSTIIGAGILVAKNVLNL